MSNEISTLVTSELSTVNAKGAVRSFERSIAFASRDARQGLLATIYMKQAENSNFGRIIEDALSSGLVLKANKAVIERKIADMQMPRNPGKAAALKILELINDLRVESPKGEKQFYAAIVRDCSALLSA